MDDLKTLAIARIYLDNFANIKAYWVMLGEKIAQVSLAFGVNDLDGTVVEEKIGHDAGRSISPGHGEGRDRRTDTEGRDASRWRGIPSTTNCEPAEEYFGVKRGYAWQGKRFFCH